MFIKTIYWLSYYDLFFGSHSIVYILPQSLGHIKDMAFLLYNSPSTGLGYFFIYGALIFLVLSFLFKKIPFVFEFIIWLLVVNIHNKIYPSLTGGDFLLNQFLFFNCFLAKNYANNSNWQTSLSKCVHNFGLLAIVIQIQLVYLIAGIAKLNSADWFSGVALIDLEKVQHYNLFSTRLITTTFIGYVLNYLVIFYQVLFPVFIWVHKLKKPFMLIGILMHVYIIFVTGLVGFGLIMLIPYVLFWPTKPLNNF